MKGTAVIDSRFLGAAAIALALMLACSARANPFHLAPDGDDARSGTSRAEAVATLKRAWELAASQPASESVTVLVHPGRYVGQWIRIDGAPPTAVTLRGVTSEGKRPVFDGGPRARETWLRLWASQGRPTGLTIEGLEIRNYHTAISLDGNRDDPAADNHGTVIRDNLFVRIGTIASNDPKAVSSAAIRFVNSSGNSVERNNFVTIRNVNGCGGLHALYLAHFSSRNRIVQNRIDDFCGSAIRFRDRANDNLVAGNVYQRAEASPAVEEWFCDMKGRKGCTKEKGECPSTGNVDTRNSIEETADTKRVSIIGPTTPRPWCEPDDFRRARVVTHD